MSTPLLRQLRCALNGRHLATRTQKPTSDVEPLVNEALLRLPRVRLIDASGRDDGLMSPSEALTRARAAGLDVMQVGAGSEGAVVRLVDFAAYDDARKKKAYLARKKRKESRMIERREGGLKQLRLSPATDAHDMATKMRQATEFLKSGYRLRIYMQFRRGQGRLSEEAKQALISAAEQLQTFGRVQGIPDGGGIPDLFKEPPKKEDGEEPLGVVKRKPLQVLIQPLPRKLREQSNKEMIENG